MVISAGIEPAPPAYKAGVLGPDWRNPTDNTNHDQSPLHHETVGGLGGCCTHVSTLPLAFAVNTFKGIQPSPERTLPVGSQLFPYPQSPRPDHTCRKFIRSGFKGHQRLPEPLTDIISLIDHASLYETDSHPDHPCSRTDSKIFSEFRLSVNGTQA